MNKTLVLIGSETPEVYGNWHKELGSALKCRGFKAVETIGTECFIGSHTEYEHLYMVVVSDEQHLNDLLVIGYEYMQDYLFVVNMDTLKGSKLSCRTGIAFDHEYLSFLPSGGPNASAMFHARAKDLLQLYNKPLTVIPGKGILAPAIHDPIAVAMPKVLDVPADLCEKLDDSQPKMTAFQTLHEQRMSGDKRRSYPAPAYSPLAHPAVAQRLMQAPCADFNIYTEIKGGLNDA